MPYGHVPQGLGKVTLYRARLPDLQLHRDEGPGRDLRSDADHRGAARADPQGRLHRRDPRDGPAPGHEDPAAVRPAEGAGGHDDDAGGSARDARREPACDRGARRLPRPGADDAEARRTSSGRRIACVATGATPRRPAWWPRAWRWTPAASPATCSPRTCTSPSARSSRPSANSAGCWGAIPPIRAHFSAWPASRWKRATSSGVASACPARCAPIRISRRRARCSMRSPPPTQARRRPRRRRAWSGCGCPAPPARSSSWTPRGAHSSSGPRSRAPESRLARVAGSPGPHCTARASVRSAARSSMTLSRRISSAPTARSRWRWRCPARPPSPRACSR